MKMLMLKVIAVIGEYNDITYFNVMHTYMEVINTSFIFDIHNLLILSSIYLLSHLLDFCAKTITPCQPPGPR